MTRKSKHKKLKSIVQSIEVKRNDDRTSGLWYDLRTFKKLKLKAKDKLNEYR